MLTKCVKHIDVSHARHEGHRRFVLMPENVVDFVPALKNFTVLKHIQKNEPVLQVHASGISLLISLSP